MNFVNMVSILKWTGTERYPAALFILLVVFFLSPQKSNCEFYKYLDKNGKIHFVDSKTKIPREYRKDLISYDEKYDHLSEEERDKRIAEDRRKIEDERKEKETFRREQVKRQEQQRHREKIEEEERREINLKAERRKEQQAKQEEFMKNFETKFEIEGYNSVLVPCTLGYKNKKVEARLILDTGCEITLLHENVAKQLGLKKLASLKGSLADGSNVKTNVSKLEYIKVGPYKVEDFYITVMKVKNPRGKSKGLLGMNFLAGRDYKIDYVQKVVRWVP